MEKDLKQNEIQRLINKRKILLDKYEDSWNEETMKYSMEEPIEIDKLAVQIEDKIIENQEILDVDFIIESLTHLGQAPNLLYDDNGYFAVTCEGYQTVVTESPADVETAFMVPAKKWKPTIREAIIYYLNDNDEEDE